MEAHLTHNQENAGSWPVSAISFRLGRNICQKEVKIYLIKISRNDASYMRKAGYEYFVKKSYSGHSTYYLVEEKDTYEYNPKTHKRELVKRGALYVYRRYRNSIIVR